MFLSIFLFYSLSMICYQAGEVQPPPTPPRCVHVGTLGEGPDARRTPRWPTTRLHCRRQPLCGAARCPCPAAARDGRAPLNMAGDPRWVRGTWADVHGPPRPGRTDAEMTLSHRPRWRRRLCGSTEQAGRCAGGSATERGAARGGEGLFLFSFFLFLSCCPRGLHGPSWV